MRHLFSLVLIAQFVYVQANAQARSFSDPAQMYNRLVLEKANMVTRIGNYKVQGTPYLYGGMVSGIIYMRGKSPAETFTGFNTYYQVVEYAFSQNGEYITPDGITDSFTLKSKPDVQLNSDIKFINGELIKAPEKGFYQVVYAGPHYALYKFYKSVLTVVSTNYVDANLRQFDLNYEYYYRDISQDKVKKLKPNNGFVKKEFKTVPAAATAATDDDFAYSPEAALVKVFTVLNQ